MFALLIAAAAMPQVPDRHYFRAAFEVNNAATCVESYNREARNLRGELARLEVLAAILGLGA